MWIQKALQRGLWLCLAQLYIRQGRRRVSCYAVGVEFVRRLRTHDLLDRAYGVAFNFTLALFPATIFVFTLIPHMPIPGLDQKIIVFLEEILPADTYKVLAPTVADTIGTQRKGLLSLGFVSTLYLATNGMVSLIKTFELFYQDAARAPSAYFKKRGVAVLLTLLLTLVLFCAMVLLTVGSQLLGYMVQEGLIASRWQLNLLLGLRLCTVALILLTAIATIYYVAPVARRPWPFFSWGAFVATLLSLGASFGFSYYVNNFGSYNQVYGSIGIFIVLMTWLFVLAAILLVGFVLNASIDALVRKAAKEEEAY